MLRKKLRHLSFIAGCMLYLGTIIGQSSYAHMQHNVRIVDSKPVFTGTVYAQRKLSKKLGITSFALITEGWGEILIGSYYKLNESASIGVQVGMETASPDPRFCSRFGISFTYFDPKKSYLVFLEKGNGSDNYWYSLAANYGRKVTFGALAQRYYGIGPTLGIPIKNLTLRFCALYDFEAKKNYHLQPALFFKWVM